MVKERSKSSKTRQTAAAAAERRLGALISLQPMQDTQAYRQALLALHRGDARGQIGLGGGETGGGA
jgi:hypothetical protein